MAALSTRRPLEAPVRLAFETCTRGPPRRITLRSLVLVGYADAAAPASVWRPAEPTSQDDLQQHRRGLTMSDARDECPGPLDSAAARATASADHRSRCTQGHAAASLRVEATQRGGRTQRRLHPDGQFRVRRPGMLRRAGQHAGLRAPRQRRLALHQHAHRAGLLADASGPAHRPQLAQREHGRRSRDGHGVSRHELRASPVRRTAGRRSCG